MIIGLSVQRVDSVLKPHTHRRSVRLGHFYPLLSAGQIGRGSNTPLHSDSLFNHYRERQSHQWYTCHSLRTTIQALASHALPFYPVSPACTATPAPPNTCSTPPLPPDSHRLHVSPVHLLFVSSATGEPNIYRKPPIYKRPGTVQLAPP